MSFLAQLEENSKGNQTFARRFIGSLNQNEIRELCKEIYSRVFWRARCPHWYSASRKQIAFIHWVLRIASKKLTSGTARKELSKFGSVVVRDSFILGDALDFQVLKLDRSWHSYLMHTSYDAVWYQPSTLKICTFCEGDVIYQHCPTSEIFDAEIAAIREWYEEN